MVKGFEFRHAGRSANGYVVNVDNGGGKWAEYITFRDNVFHDSYDNDLMKVHAGARFVNIQGNVFYNQGDSEQHIDANSVTDVKIQDNIFFNDFGASGRSARDSKHFIVVKDSGKFDDGLNGSERVTLRRNVFMNWEGGNEAFVQIGNDGERYHEAKFVRVENNLFLGNSSDRAGSSFGVSGAKKVTFRNNTIVGNLPAHTFGFRIETKGSNPPNRNITFSNNIWSDHTGTMDDFTSGESGETVGLRLDTNLYWNGGKALPDGDVVTPRDDANRVVANPRLSKQHGAVVVPIWKGSKFASGAKTIRDEFVRIVTEYAAIPSNSGAVDRADPRSASRQDILGRSRGGSPDLGAFEAGARGLG